MPIEKIKPVFHFEAERIGQLKQVVPEAFADGKINWDTLQEALGNFLEENTTAEHFGLFWPGKKMARKVASMASEGTLIPCKGDGLDEDNTNNVFIEGENLEVLKLLQKSYSNRIKMIYIDPPYNTGNDFIYEDDFTESIDEYLIRTGQLDEEAKPISVNTKSDGRFHSKWLSMMYPRLRLARNLLRNDGVIFISIGQIEFANLMLLCNEVFGEENKIGTFTRLSKTGGNKGKFYSPNTEFILIYARNVDSANGFREEMDPDLIKKVYTQVEKDGPKKGQIYRAMGLYQSSLDARANQRYFIEAPDKTLVIPPGNTFPTEFKEGCKIKPESNDDGVWRWTYERYLQEKKKGNIEFKETKNKVLVDQFGSPSIWNVNTKIWLNDRQEDGQLPVDFIDKFESRHSSKELQELDIPFDFAKPSELISYLIQIVGVGENDIVLDFFAGSGTLGHAIYSLNQKDKISRNFICVQLPEKIDEGSEAFNAGFVTISELSKERIRRVAKRAKESNYFPAGDFGFLCYKLVKSNFNKWRDYEGTNLKELEIQYENNTTPLVPNWTPDNLRSEIILMEGFSLTSKVSSIRQFKENEITVVTSDFCEHKLFICLDKKIHTDTIKNLQLNDDDIFICLDSAITDRDKVTLQDKGLIKTI